ncbi:MAG TPA: serine hydrolase, partial [Segetibacter sp.]|nr:serine hydrolase [Segetibacter sp.]
MEQQPGETTNYQQNEIAETKRNFPAELRLLQQLFCYSRRNNTVVSGKPWEVYVYDSIIMPLAMTNTHTLAQGISQRPNVSKPYTTSFTGKLTELPYDNIDNLGPAGSIVSNVKDLSRWLL